MADKNDNNDTVETVLFDKDGNQIEGALSVEQVQTKIEEAKNKWEEEHNQNLEEIQGSYEEQVKGLQEELNEAKEALEKAEEKDLNFSSLRKNRDEKAKAVEALEGKISKLEESIGELKTGQSQKAIDDAIDQAVASASGDKDLKDKVKHFFGQFATPKTEEELKERVGSALILAQGGEGRDVLNSGNVSASGGGPMPQPTIKGSKKFDDPEAAKEVAKKMNISEQQLKKHGYI